MVVVVIVLTGMCAGQWLIIWRLLDRLLIKASVSPLGPIISTAPPEKPERVETRKKLFSVKVDG